MGARGKLVNKTCLTTQKSLLTLFLFLFFTAMDLKSLVVIFYCLFLLTFYQLLLFSGNADYYNYFY